jgi:quercetin dioxygenase-like cupin family protein
LKRLVTIILMVIGVFSGFAVAQNVDFEPILPSSLRWESPPDTPGLQRSWVIGAEHKSGLYILRVKLLSGARILPHSHPDERNTTVLAGTIYAGFGESFDESKVIAIPAGAVYITPANVPHYLWAKEGDTIFQEAGIGPTKTTFIVR